MSTLPFNNTDVTIGNVMSQGLDDVIDSDFTTHPFFKHYFWLAPVRVIIGGITVVLNVATVVALGMSRRMRSGQRASLINLSITGAVAGATSIYHALATLLIQEGGVKCDVMYSLLSLVLVASNLTLVLMSAERALSLWFPYRYMDFMTSFRLAGLAVLNWVLAAVVTALRAPRTDARSVCNFLSGVSTTKFALMSGLGFTFTCGVLSFHGVVYVSALKQIRKIVPTVPQGGASRFRKVQREMKATVTTAMLVLPYALLTAPLFGVAGFLAGNPRQRHQPEFFFLADLCVAALLLNSLVNPVIYIWRLSQVRRTLLAILTRGRCPDSEGIAAISTIGMSSVGLAPFGP